MEDIEYNESRRKHVCTLCNNEFYWNDDCSWYGVLDNGIGEQIILEKCCSQSCRDKSQWVGDDITF